MTTAYVFIAIIFLMLMLMGLIVGKELENLHNMLEIYLHDDKSQMELNENMLKQQDRMLSRIGDLNTRVIELEARIPEPVYTSTDTDGDATNLFPDVEDEDIVI